MKSIGVPMSAWSRRSSFHGSLRGGDAVRRSSISEGRFGRMFRALPAAEFTAEDLHSLAEKMEADAETDDGKRSATPEKTRANPDVMVPDDEENFGIPTGYTYLGQFIDHDITFDPSSLSMQRADPDAMIDFRTPRLDLDCVYGRGPADQPYMYVEDRKFLLGDTALSRAVKATPARDLPRLPNGRAVIGDKRNDENVIVSQLQGVFLNFHNAVCDEKGADTSFDDIQRLVRWHYQWMVLTDFLPRMVGNELMARILPGFAERKINIHTHPPQLQFYHWRNEPFMPVEFSAAAYRFGHSMIRPIYRLSTELTEPVGDEHPSIQGRKFVFSADRNKGLNGFEPFPSSWAIDWSLFFELGGKVLDPADLGPARVQPAYKIDTSLVNPLKFLPEFSRSAMGGGGNLEHDDAGNPIAKPGDVSNLAERNLLRGQMLGLPSGQAVAHIMDIEPIPDSDLKVGKAIVDQLENKGNSLVDISPRFAGNAPLWYYVLAEAQYEWTKAATAARDNDVARNAIPVRLGPVGGRIVAEVLIGLLVGDHRSVLWQAPNWKPDFANAEGEFKMPDMIRMSGLG